MKRFLTVAATLCGAAVVLAATTVVGSFGQGHAMSQNGKRSEFRFEAAKRTADGSVRVNGVARFIAFGGTQAVPESHGIFIPEVRVLGKDGRVCQFGGPAQMQVRNGASYILLRGHATFNVADRREPNATTGDPDRISVRFVNAADNRVWEYTGLLTRGDIVVFERIEP